MEREARLVVELPAYKRRVIAESLSLFFGDFPCVFKKMLVGKALTLASAEVVIASFVSSLYRRIFFVEPCRTYCGNCAENNLDPVL